MDKAKEYVETKSMEAYELIKALDAKHDEAKQALMELTVKLIHRNR